MGAEPVVSNPAVKSFPDIIDLSIIELSSRRCLDISALLLYLTSNVLWVETANPPTQSMDYLKVCLFVRSLAAKVSYSCHQRLIRTSIHDAIGLYLGFSFALPVAGYS